MLLFEYCVIKSTNYLWNVSHKGHYEDRRRLRLGTLTFGIKIPKFRRNMWSPYPVLPYKLALDVIPQRHLPRSQQRPRNFLLLRNSNVYYCACEGHSILLHRRQIHFNICPFSNNGVTRPKLALNVYNFSFQYVLRHHPSYIYIYIYI